MFRLTIYTVCVFYYLGILAEGYDLKAPEFIDGLSNLTVALGRDATFKCRVHNLGDFRVGWVKTENKAIQAIHLHVITHNPRVRVSHADASSWSLHIRNVQLEDEGMYMCQVNSDPMISQYGYLRVVVPPDIITEKSSSDVTVPEGGQVKLICRAQGHPAPTVRWRREDGRTFTVEISRPHLVPLEHRVKSFDGEILTLSKLRRDDSGNFFCIASNGLPPSVSKTIHVEVQFAPLVETQHQLHGAALGSDVTLSCRVQAVPRSVNFWLKDPNEMLVSGVKYSVREQPDSDTSSWTHVTIRNFRSHDAGLYICVAKNTIGQVQANIQVYEMRLTKDTTKDDRSEEQGVVYNWDRTLGTTVRSSFEQYAPPAVPHEYNESEKGSARIARVSLICLLFSLKTIVLP